MSPFAALLICGYFLSAVSQPLLAAPRKASKTRIHKAPGKKIPKKEEAPHGPLPPAPSQGEAPRLQTLKEVLEYVYQTHPRLGAARAEKRANDEGVIKAKSAWLPKLNVTGTHDVQKTRTVQSQSGSKFKYISLTDTAGVKLTQQLFDLGATNANIRAARKTVLANEASYISTEQEVLLEAIKAYINVIRETKGLAIAQDLEKTLAENFKYDEARFQVGELTKADLDLARASLDGAIAGVTTAQGDLEKSKAAFLQAVGQMPGHLKMPSHLNNLPKNLEEVKQVALKKNPGLLNAMYSLDAAKSQSDAAYGAIQPSANLQLNANRDVHSRGPSKGSRNVGELTATLNIPLYQTENFATIRQNQEGVISKKLALNYAYFTITQQSISGWTTLITSQAKVKQQQAQVAATTESVMRYREEERAGAGDIFRRLQTQQDLFSRRQQLNQTEAEAIINQYTLLAIMGELTPEMLGLEVDIYDPKENYNRVKNAAFGFKTEEMEEVFPEEKASLEIPEGIQKEIDKAVTPSLSQINTKSMSNVPPQIKYEIDHSLPLSLENTVKEREETVQPMSPSESKKRIEGIEPVSFKEEEVKVEHVTPEEKESPLGPAL